VLYSPGGLVGIWATLFKALVAAAGRIRGDEQPENLRRPAAAGLPAAERLDGIVLDVPRASRRVLAAFAR